MIEVKNLSKIYGSNKAIDDISFGIQKGEVVGLLGPNGAGKTTTMKILTCYMPPTSGSVTIDGLDIDHDSLAIREKIGYLPENAPLYYEMNVLEYLKFAAEMHHVPKKDLKDRIKEVVKDCRLEDKLFEEISHLSKGYKQRVGLAQSLISDPDLLILDEPTVGLDPNQIVEIRELIKKIGQRKTVILSSHILAEVEATCDRVLIINGGKIVASGTPGELRSQSEGQSKIILKVEKNYGRDIISAFKNMEGILSQNLMKSHENNIEMIELEIQKGMDLRKEIVNFLSKNNFQLLELRKEELKLEDIFKQLTK